MSTRVCLEHIDEIRNMRRFYLMEVQPNLFGEWVLIREYGRIGSPGRVLASIHPSLDAAAHQMVHLWKRKVRRGYATPAKDRMPSTLGR